MKTWTAILLILIAMGLLVLLGGTSLNLKTTPNEKPAHRLKPTTSDLEERSSLIVRASRARSLDAAAHAATTTTSKPPSPTTLKPHTSQKKAPSVQHTAPNSTILAPPQATSNNCGPGKKSREHARACYFPLIQKYPWPQERAFATLYCESTGNPSAVNGHHWGLFQLDTGPFWDPATNVEVAYNAYYKPRGNFSKWEC